MIDACVRMFNLIYIFLTLFSFVKNEDFLSKGGKDHPCYRSCENTTPMICVYNFTIRKHTTMSLDCGKCPYERKDCFNPRCIPGGGLVRTAIAVNYMIPGPSILVCERDRIIVNVKNELRTESVTIHWHGLHQDETPFMDGVPWITQLPISPYSLFTYNFTAEPHGTHLWHGHSGYQESDGLFGVITVRRKEPIYMKKLYDHDLPEHGIIIWHWYNQPSQEILLPILQRNESVFGFGFLINGKASFSNFTTNGQTFSTPREILRVSKGYKYRFRVAYNAAIYCPVQLSIDGHKLLMISGDTSPFEPVEVDSFMLGAGDRFDFVLNANMSGCFWVRLRAFGDCDESKSSVHSEWLLCYDNATAVDVQHNYQDANRLGTLLNPAEIATREYKGNDLVHLVDLNSTETNLANYSGKADEIIYVQIHSRPFDDIPYPGPWHQFNNVSFEFPNDEFLKGGFDTKDFCTDETKVNFCTGELCSCPYIKTIKKGSLVELVMVDISYNRNQDHPIHLHGNSFFIVAMGTNKSLEELKYENENSLVVKKLTKAPVRDSISVPNRGYAIVRFFAKNPGFWMFHCHVTNHMEMGMAMIFQIGTKDEILSRCKSNPQQCKGWFRSSATSFSTPFLTINIILYFILILEY